MDTLSYLSNADTGSIEALYQEYQKNPETLDISWQRFFEGFELAQKFNGNGSTTQEGGLNHKELQVMSLIEGYRQRGHLLSTTNPVRQRKDRKPHLTLSDYGLNEQDLTSSFQAGSLIGLPNASLQQIIDKLNLLYCGNIGIEYTYIDNTTEREWVQKEFESSILSRNYPLEKEKRILSKLNEAVVFENFLHTKYVGQKRFSLEGGETTIPALDAIINHSAEFDVKEIVIGMAHRGRLNVLANTLGKTYEYIFSEFEGTQAPDTTMGDGDVKYHMGFSSEIKTLGGKTVYVKLMPNPSHLEAVNSVVQGYSRAKADVLYKEDYKSVLQILIHGDAALAGQGVVYEVAQMANLHGYYTGGTIHFVINNQIGFTTDFDDARSSTYSTGVAKVTDCPILHVNGDDPESVVYAVEFAVKYRQAFGKDVYVDMVCYRKHGHNESDEPKYTQPNLYNLIAKHANPREVYTQALIAKGSIEAKMAKEMEVAFKSMLQDRLNEVKQKPLPYKAQATEQEWLRFRRATPDDFDKSPATGVKQEVLQKVANALSTIPDTIKPIKKVEKLLQERKQRFEESKLDWAMGELLAYGSLLMEGNDIRMSGQDVIRGTFSHRHSCVFDEQTATKYCGLNFIDSKQGKFRIYNSLLSEYAVMGFEYGYSIAHPNTLTIWEAQFGDFANGAQVMIDQFLSSGESKWQRMSGLILLLPHGYEGQGPEHSSARGERFLQLAAEYNMVVANCTTPANYFHLLRRQLTWDFRKPLIVLTPKSLLRHPLAVSTVDELTKGNFQELITDSYADKKKVKRVLFCSGKIYYDLLEKQLADKRKDIALVRVEQLYPMPEKQIDAVMAQYKTAEFVWVQEEPKNMGAWTFWLRREEHKIFKLISRKASASPATGYAKVHAQQQLDIVNQAFAV